MSILKSRESTLERRLRNWVVGVKDGLYLKMRPAQTGYPDRLILLPSGLHLWVELKRRGQKPSSLQLYRLRALRAHGAIADWFDDFYQVAGWITYHEQRAQNLGHGGGHRA